MIRFSIFVLIVLSSCQNLISENKELQLVDYNQIITGSQNFDKYYDLIKDKKVGVLVNQSSLVGNTHLVDFLRENNIDIIRIFSPEHGFRGSKDAGEIVKNGVDTKTGLTVVSLYGGKHKKPSKDDLNNIEVLIIDLQDVGVRFYTYISTMTLAMEACAENNIPVIVLDRPNPNGFYVDGPVLNEDFKSFVGMHKVPVVYGMTIGEYAKMVNGEGWLKNKITCDLTVVPLKKYTHNMIVKLNIAPSPNLPDWISVYLYPSLCFFEGTVVSVGRGTKFPFKVFGHPELPYDDFTFTPESIPGKSTHPKLEGKLCHGKNLIPYAYEYKDNPRKLNLSWLIDSYNKLKYKADFFNSYFDKLTGNDDLRRQITEGETYEQIRESWQGDLDDFKIIRKKYLIYE
jgi:uncharacterized protein YbbC (DUF1343 family)